MPTPFDETPAQPAPVLFGYDLAAPGRGDASVDLHAGWNHQLVTDAEGGEAWLRGGHIVAAGRGIHAQIMARVSH